MIYKITFSPTALADIEKLKKSEPLAFKKIQRLVVELMEHPYTGSGKPKPLKHDYAGCYSRRITQKHRLVYSVDEEEIVVLVLSALSHYGEK